MIGTCHNGTRVGRRTRCGCNALRGEFENEHCFVACETRAAGVRQPAGRTRPTTGRMGPGCSPGRPGRRDRHPPWRQWQQPLTPGGHGGSQPARPPLDLGALANGHLFGAAPPAAPADDANAPQTNMPLVLTGIIAAADPQNGIAIIGTTATNTKLYPVGERVPGNARVHAVYVDRCCWTVMA